MDGYEVEHEFPDIGRRTMLLNARKVFSESNAHTTLLLGYRRHQRAARSGAGAAASAASEGAAAGGDAASHRQQPADHRQHSLAEGENASSRKRRAGTCRMPTSA